MTTSLSFELHLPEPTEAESHVVHRRLEIVIRDEPPMGAIVPIDQYTIGDYFGQHNDRLVVRSWNAYASGNESLEPSVLDTVLLDPFHPPTPGQVSVRVTGKSTIPDRAYETMQDQPSQHPPGTLLAGVKVKRNPNPEPQQPDVRYVQIKPYPVPATTPRDTRVDITPDEGILPDVVTVEREAIHLQPNESTEVKNGPLRAVVSVTNQNA